jgi:hypothetical protein
VPDLPVDDVHQSIPWRFLTRAGAGALPLFAGRPLALAVLNLFSRCEVASAITCWVQYFDALAPLGYLVEPRAALSEALRAEAAFGPWSGGASHAEALDTVAYAFQILLDVVYEWAGVRLEHYGQTLVGAGFRALEEHAEWAAIEVGVHAGVFHAWHSPGTPRRLRIYADDGPAPLRFLTAGESNGGPAAPLALLASAVGPENIPPPPGTPFPSAPPSPTDNARYRGSPAMSDDSEQPPLDLTSETVRRLTGPASPPPRDACGALSPSRRQHYPGAWRVR